MKIGFLSSKDRGGKLHIPVTIWLKKMFIEQQKYNYRRYRKKTQTLGTAESAYVYMVFRSTEVLSPAMHSLPVALSLVSQGMGDWGNYLNKMSAVKLG